MSDDKPYTPYNPDVVEHIASGNEALIQACSRWRTPTERDSEAVLATAHFQAAIAKATAMAVFDTDVNAAVEGVMMERAERRKAARERMGR